MYQSATPTNWTFNEMNKDEGSIRKLLAADGYKNVTVPYRQNRIVIFDSKLFHKTDEFRFKEGYENRRINLTFLYGTRKRSERD